MLTDEGKMHIKRYMAGIVPSIAQSIAVGIGDAIETATDKKLQFEVGRADIILTSFDFVNNRLVFKAAVPEEIGGSILEVGLYSMATDELAGEFGSRLLTSFDSASEGWINPTTLAAATFTTSGMRIGADSLRLVAGANSSLSATLPELFLDLSGFSGADKFVFAYNVANAFVSSISFRFMTDSSNYYQISLGAQTAGYKIAEALKSSATVTGAPSWDNITEIRVTVNSTADGSGQVDFDGIRIDDMDTLNTEYVLVSREVLPSAFIKQEGRIQEVEFYLDINV